MFGKLCGMERRTIDIIPTVKLLAMILFLPVAALAVTVELDAMPTNNVEVECRRPGFMLEVR